MNCNPDQGTTGPNAYSSIPESMPAHTYGAAFNMSPEDTVNYTILQSMMQSQEPQIHCPSDISVISPLYLNNYLEQSWQQLNDNSLSISGYLTPYDSGTGFKPEQVHMQGHLGSSLYIGFPYQTNTDEYDLEPTDPLLDCPVEVPPPRICNNNKHIYRARFQAYREPSLQRMRNIQIMVAHGYLSRAQQELKVITQWVKKNFQSAGLALDLDTSKDDNRTCLDETDQEMLGEVTRFWKAFNYCWLALFTRHIENADQNKRSNGTLEVLSLDMLEASIDMVFNLGETLKDEGLVDFQCGLEEARIMEVAKLAVLLMV